jgi:parvulin-like peptidyl-prolyl isomerase
MADTDAALPLSAEALRWLADLQLLKPALRAHLLRQALSPLVLDPEEQGQALQSFAQQQGIKDATALEQFCAANLIQPTALQALAERPLRLERLCQRDFVHKAEARFLDRKNALDRVVYSLLRLQEPGLARELYLRIADREADFAQLAQQYSQGPERQTRGIVGPVPIQQAHPELARRLRTTPPGQLLEPFQIETWWLVVRVESYTPANFDEKTRDAMAKELFEEWLESEVNRQLQAIGKELGQ